ncbi:hypothetical protein [Streptomyces sp. NPDC056527]|uniref:hypothetical protein n=1 Tax=Streptomyces sp. NPDC056527 TaxID=3345853 RepID=UPI0036C49EA8
MHNRTTTAAIATCLLLALTACGSTTEDPKANPTTTNPTTATTTAAAEPTNASTTTLVLGSTLKWDDPDGDISGTSAALSYEQGVKSAGSAAEETGQPGYVWAALELKVCSTKGVFLATTFPWTLSYADGARIEPSSSTWEDFPKPEFPVETKLAPGRCVRGKVVYPVPGNNRPATVVYAPESADMPVEWTIPAK